MRELKQIKEFVNKFKSSIYSLNIKGAKYYGATFYDKNKWDGTFGWWLDDVKDYDIIINIDTMKFIKKGLYE